MTNEQLNDYVQKAHKTGMGDKRIKKELIKAGCQEAQFQNLIQLKHKRKIWLKIVLGFLILFIALGILWLSYPSPFIYAYVRWTCPESKYPGLYKRLSTKSIASTDTLNSATEFDGLKFSSPWNNPIDVKRQDSSILYKYEDDKSLMILKIPEPGFSSSFKEHATDDKLMKFKEYVINYFGKDVTISDYDYLSSIYSISPSDMKLIISSSRANVLLTFVILKKMLLFMDDKDAQFFSFESKYIRGIQSTSSKFTDLSIWTHKGDYYEIMLKGATPSEVDFILKSLH